VLEKQIVNSGQAKFLLEFYLSEENFQLLKALNLVASHPRFLEQIVDLDLQLLVYLLQQIDTGISQNEGALNGF
jgi:hypothetical protein